MVNHKNETQLITSCNDEDNLQCDVVLPDFVIVGVRDSLEQANKGLLTPFTGVRDMLDIK